MSDSADQRHERIPRQDRRAQHLSGGRVVPADHPALIEALLADRVVSILLGAGFPSLLVQRGQVVLSGFMRTLDADERVLVHWTGIHEVNALPYRRTFLGAYASVRRQSGLTVAYLEGDGEPYLTCEASYPPGM